MKKIVLFILFVFAIQICFGQSEGTSTKLQRKAEHKKEQQARSAAKAEEKGRKRHIKLQSKDVRKRMKRNSKRYDHVDSFDRRPNLIQRIFHRKRPSAY